jgi:MATE family multidrug resistance protein
MSQSTPSTESGTGSPAPQHPVVEVWVIAWPTILTMTSYTVMQFVDKLMVGQVSPLAFTAQSNGGIWSFTPLVWVMGALTVVNTYVSQNLGAGTPQHGPKYAWTAIWLSLMSWVVLMVPMGFVMPWIFSHMGDHSPDLRQMESGYAQILLFGSVVLLCSRGLNQYFFGMHKPKVVTVATIVGNITNVIFNYIFIFGSVGLTAYADDGRVLFDLPGVPGVKPLGVYGAAIGTVIGTATELVIPMAVFLSRRWNDKYHTRSAWRPNQRAIRDVIKIGWSVSIQWGNEIVCWALFMSVIVGMFGEHHMTAGWAALAYMHLAFMPSIGMSTAVNSLVGKYIGAGKPDVAVHRAHLGLALTVAYMTFCGLMFYIFRHPMVSLFVGGDIPAEDAQQIIAIGGRLMICAAIFQTFDALAIIYTGALRGAGDTLWPSIATIIYSWVFIMGLGWALARYVPQWESVGPWVGASAFIIFYGITMTLRFEMGGWRKIKLLRTPEEEAAEHAPVGPTPPASCADASVSDVTEWLDEHAAIAPAPADRAPSEPTVGSTTEPG